MGQAAHLESLQQKHAALEDQIAAQYARPLPDDIALRQLKTIKLKIKEKIEAIRTS